MIKDLLTPEIVEKAVVNKVWLVRTNFFYIGLSLFIICLSAIVFGIVVYRSEAWEDKCNGDNDEVGFTIILSSTILGVVTLFMALMPLSYGGIVTEINKSKLLDDDKAIIEEYEKNYNDCLQNMKLYEIEKTSESLKANYLNLANNCKDECKKIESEKIDIKAIDIEPEMKNWHFCILLFSIIISSIGLHVAFVVPAKYNYMEKNRNIFEDPDDEISLSELIEKVDISNPLHIQEISKNCKVVVYKLNNVKE